MKTYLITLRATCLVDADSPEDARDRWEDAQERDYEADDEADNVRIDIYDDGEPVRGDKRWSHSAALDLIANVLSANEWDSDTAGTIAEIIRDTGREILGLPDVPDTEGTSDNLHPLAVLGPADPGTALGGLRGYCTATFAVLVALLGEPHVHNGDKTTVEWAFRCNDGTVFTVYDWKVPSTPLGDYAWHIGGTGQSLQAFTRHTGLHAVPY